MSGAKLRVGVVGLGKMGLSHYAMINMHPDVEVVGVCDSSSIILGGLKRYTSAPAFSSFDDLLKGANPEAVVISTPSSTHAGMVRTALERGIHVFCEKPFTLDPVESESLAKLAADRGLVAQVGYHNRYVGAFTEVKRLLDLGVIGEVTHGLGEAYGPVVLKQKGGTWRSLRSEGGGCLLDYAAHVIDLMTWFLGEPIRVGGTVLNPIYSRDTEDEVYSTLFFDARHTAHIASNWSDDSQRKMTTKVTLWGTHGRIYADRQEIQVYLRDTVEPPPGYQHGWNVRYTTELTDPVWFYLRGEEYSSQIDAFVKWVRTGEWHGIADLESAAATDRVIELIRADAEGRDPRAGGQATRTPAASSGYLSRLRRRFRRGGSA